VVPARYDRQEPVARAQAASGAHYRLSRWPDVLRLPLFTYLRARAHVPNNEPHLALQLLDRAYAEGFRMIWVLDLNPLPLFSIDWAEPEHRAATPRIQYGRGNPTAREIAATRRSAVQNASAVAPEGSFYAAPLCVREGQ
jgi:hypothetical protein